MNDDILDSILRSLSGGKNWPSSIKNRVIEELIDEIKRLRSENAELRKWLDGYRLIISNMQPKEVPSVDG